MKSKENQTIRKDSSAEGAASDSQAKKPTSANQMDRQVELGQAPESVERVDGADPEHHEQPHVHFSDGSALNKDGTWRHPPDAEGLQKQTPRQAIEKWLLTVTRNGGIERFDDLHIDKIDTNWKFKALKSKSIWIDGGLKAFRIALELRQEHGLSYAVLLKFSLRSGEKIRGIDFHSRDELAAQLNRTPPSLYLIDAVENSWARLPSQVREDLARGTAIRKELNPDLFETPVPVKKCYYSENRYSADEEYARAVYLEG